MKNPRNLLVSSALALAITVSAQASTVLLTDNFNDGAENNDAATFNDNLGTTQGGTLASVAFTVQGTGFVAQHSHAGNMVVATEEGVQYGSVGLVDNFATQANAANQPLQISFNIVDVFDYAGTNRWIQFNLGDSENLSLLDRRVGIGVFFRANGGSGVYDGEKGLGSEIMWAANDLVTVTLTDTAGTGSAFNGNGSKATVSIGAKKLGTFTLDQLTNAYLTFSAYNDDVILHGGGRIDNLRVALIPEPPAH